MLARFRLVSCVLVASALSNRGFADEPPKRGIYRATSDRVAMKFGFYSATGRVGSVQLSEVNAWVARAVEENTDLDVKELDGQVVDRCVESAGPRRRLTCMVEESSDEWIAMRNSLPQSFSEVKERLRASRTHPRYVLIISAAAVEGGDRLAALLIDVEEALGRIHALRTRASQPTREDLAELEEEISKYSVLARPPTEDDVTSSEQVKAYVEKLIGSQLRDAFVAAGRWRPFGSIEIRLGAEEPFAIELDGVSIGTTVEGKATIVDVRPGQRRISLRNEDFEEVAATIEVATGKAALFETSPIRKPSRVIYVFRQSVLWGGVLSAVAGVSLMIYAGVESRRDDRYNVCVGSSACSDPWVRFGTSNEMNPLITANGSGPPIMPLGYSLVGLAIPWVLGPLIDDDEERIPWIEAVVGIAVFGAAFGLSLALDPADPVCMTHGAC